MEIGPLFPEDTSINVNR